MKTQILFDLALQYHSRGDLTTARKYYKEILNLNPNSALALGWLGTIEAQLKNYQIAQNLMKEAINLDKNNTDFLINYANLLQEIGDYKQAIMNYEKSLRLKTNFIALSNLAACYNELKNAEQGLICAEKAISIQPTYAEAWSSRGNALFSLNRYESALSSYDRAIELRPQNAEYWSNRGNILNSLKRYEDALKNCEYAIKLDSNLETAWNNRGNSLYKLKHHREALVNYAHAIELKSNYAEAWSNQGSVLNHLKQYEEALAVCNQAIKLQPALGAAWHNRGNALDDLKCYNEALISYQKALELKPDIDFLLGCLIHTKMKICDWSALNSELENLKNGIKKEQKCSNPFPVLGLFDSPELQYSVAKVYAEETYKSSKQLGQIAKPLKRNKIRLGYFSMDFREHPVSYLTADLFSMHDRNKFEVYAFSFGPNTRDPVRLRLEKSFDRFIDVYQLEEVEISRLSRELSIDIAIDLGGLTKDSRPQIFVERSAPIQVSYLGYPSTGGHNCMDYFIGDKTTITKKNREYFFEKIIYMPHQFQVNPLSRPALEKPKKKTEFGIPDDSIVFCCFNNNWKITPSMFASWMRILREVPNSILWLYSENAWASQNLAGSACKHGVSSDRLFFANAVPSLSEHLARYKVTDLFLDTESPLVL